MPARAVTVLNLSHPLTAANRAELEALLQAPIERVVDAQVQFDAEAPFADQARRLIDALPLSAGEWQTLPLVVNLPGLSPAAAVVLAELHGRTGGFPPVVRSKRTGPLNQFAVAEVIVLQDVRDEARRHRARVEPG